MPVEESFPILTKGQTGEVISFTTMARNIAYNLKKHFYTAYKTVHKL
jgi:hypothetical protein